jgi:hypothetical protein
MLYSNVDYILCDPSFHLKIQMTTQDHGESFTGGTDCCSWNNQELPGMIIMSANLFSGRTNSMGHFVPLHFLDINNALHRTGMLHPKPGIDVNYPHYQPAKGTSNNAVSTAPPGNVPKLITDGIAFGVDIMINGLSAIAGINPANDIHRVWVMTSAHKHKPLSSVKPTTSTPSLKEHSVPASIQSMVHSFETTCTLMMMLIPHPMLVAYAELNGFTGFLIPSVTTEFNLRFDQGSHAAKSLLDLFGIKTIGRDMSQIMDPFCHSAAHPAPLASMALLSMPLSTDVTELPTQK